MNARLPDVYLERLRSLAKRHSDTSEPVVVAPATLMAMIDELRDLREELFRLSVCESVELMIIREEALEEGVPMPLPPKKIIT
ncbi:MAG: hypothetical protein AB7L09_00715 [Nitrospira sp.]